MATPLIAGCAALLRKAALIKALLVNGANILNPTTPKFVPSKESGFGRVNFANSITIMNSEPETGFREPEISNSALLWDEKIEVKANHTTLRATLVWSDPPGEVIKNKLQLGVKGSKLALCDNTVQQVIWGPTSPGNVTLTVPTRYWET